MIDKRPDAYYEGESLVWRASSFGNCEQNLVRAATGQTPEPWPESVLAGMQTGTDNEELILASMGVHGWNRFDDHDMKMKCPWGTYREDLGQIEADLSVPGGVVRCHLDGVAQAYLVKPHNMWKLKERAVVEVKIMKKSAWSWKQILAKYGWQIGIQRAVSGLPCLLVVAWKDDDGKLSGEVETQFITRHEGFERHNIMMRAARLRRFVEHAELGQGLPPCDVKQWPCGFYQEHDKKSGIWADESVELTGEALIEAKALCDEWANVSVQATQFDKRRKQITKRLLELADENDSLTGSVLRAGDYQLPVIVQKRKGFDKDAARADGVAVEKYETESVTRFVKPTFKGKK